MTIEDIRRAHEAGPFRPFTVVLADGTRVPVRHPEFLAHPGAGRTIVEFERPEVHRAVDLSLVTSLEFADGSGRQAGSSRHR